MNRLNTYNESSEKIQDYDNILFIELFTEKYFLETVGFQVTAVHRYKYLST